MFTLIAPDRLPFAHDMYERDSQVAESDDFELPHGESALELHRLVEMLGEIMFLRERLWGLENEAQRLREKLGYSPE